jgi:glyoxylase-like metal-dependent hydrolase (beta-lactamase superfamily II)
MVLGMLGTNCYLLADEMSGEAAVIDPAGEIKRILVSLRRQEFSCKMILLTHGHMDHVAGSGPLSDATGAPVFIHPLDSDALASRRNRLVGMLEGVIATRPRQVQHLGDGDQLFLGSLEIGVLHTPGHTPGGLSFYLPGHLFCGDLIFAGSIGRTDLKGGSLQALLQAVKEKVWELPSDTIIHPGHGPETTLAREKESNPFLIGIRR